MKNRNRVCLGGHLLGEQQDRLECVCVCTRTHTHSSRCVSRLWGLGGVEAGNSWDTCAQKERFTGGEEVTTDK